MSRSTEKYHNIVIQLHSYAFFRDRPLSKGGGGLMNQWGDHSILGPHFGWITQFKRTIMQGCQKFERIFFDQVIIDAKSVLTFENSPLGT